jgi:hypothetical protein
MKAPAKDDVQKILLRKKANDKIDEAVNTGKKHGADPFEVVLLDKVMRPYALALIDERFRPDADAVSARDAVCSFAANFLSEFLIQIAERDDLDEAVTQANNMMTTFSEHFGFCMQVNYGLTGAVARGSVVVQGGDNDQNQN